MCVGQGSRPSCPKCLLCPQVKVTPTLRQMEVHSPPPSSPQSSLSPALPPTPAASSKACSRSPEAWEQRVTCGPVLGAGFPN